MSGQLCPPPGPPGPHRLATNGSTNWQHNAKWMIVNATPTHMRCGATASTPHSQDSLPPESPEIVVGPLQGGVGGERYAET